MTSAIPAWKAELQRRRKEKNLNKDVNGGVKEKKWVDEFNEPVNVIIISSTERDPDDDAFGEDPFMNHHQDSSTENQRSSVLEEHVSSVRNNPFLKFDQLISSRTPGSPTRPTYLRRQSSGSISSLKDKDSPDSLDLKSRSKSVDNLSFHLQNQAQETDSADKVQGKGLIASLRERFGKPASASDFLAAVKRPRGKSQTSYNVQEVEERDKRKEHVTITSLSVSSKQSPTSAHSPDRKNPTNVSKVSTDNDSNKTSTLSSQSLSKRNDQKPAVPPANQSSSDVPHPELPSRPAKKTSNLSASTLISLDPVSPTEGVKQPEEAEKARTENTEEADDETDSIGRLLPQVIVESKSTKRTDPMGGNGVNKVAHGKTENVSEEIGSTITTTQMKNGVDNSKSSVNERTQERRQDDKVMPSGKPVPDSKQSNESDFVTSFKTESIHRQVNSSGKSSPAESDVTVQVNSSGKSSPAESDVTVKSLNVGKPNITQTSGNREDKANEDKSVSSNQKTADSIVRSTLSGTPPAKQPDTKNVSPSRPSPSGPEAKEESPFAIKLRKVENPSATGIKVVRSSKGNSINKKAAPKRDVKTVLKEQQYNGDIIPVTNIDDVRVEAEPAKVRKVDFEVIGFNTQTGRSSMVKGKGRREKSQMQLRFNQDVQTHQYPSEESALKDYIAEHGYEPEEEIVVATGNDDDEDEEMELDEETKKKTMNNNTSLFSQGLHNITKTGNVDLSSFLGRGPHRKEAPKPAADRRPHSPPPNKKREPEVVATPLDDADGFSMGSSSALLF